MCVPHDFQRDVARTSRQARVTLQVNARRFKASICIANFNFRARPADKYQVTSLDTARFRLISETSDRSISQLERRTFQR